MSSKYVVIKEIVVYAKKGQPAELLTGRRCYICAKSADGKTLTLLIDRRRINVPTEATEPTT